ncbi:Ethanolamine-phosphate cytidylyltransferase [Chloropicon primus]|uniref:ethanolamine-phosphate cytidylyltransferase n=1 Tax=Chloropicon primus TaxID=1764295 RepID=A0A5B8MSU6_9CHLO|nr:Ethanolamine-phosphate cytidylyltransferase [Chloropicon primus]UPR02942.1 Ethanolamine-phosphate cytidylyltransferase [Chloropicon primus]|eukprot:QDZ23729.1 Ethanolamine-phosphate cytidylyltransferase [Chloropicon primus]
MASGGSGSEGDASTTLLTYKVVKGCAILAASAAAIWLGSEVWDRSCERYAGTGRKGSQWVRKNLRYKPGSTTEYLSKVLKQHSDSRKKRRPRIVYMDGCFDMMHYGHANALRQARACGDYLIVGVVSDEEILKNKGPPVFSEEERITMVKAVKWVDEVITGVPYEVTEEFMRMLFKKHKIDYIIHGDDPCLLPDGRDAYELAKKAGRYMEIKRTEGVSSTDIVGRMLLCSHQVSPFKRSKRHLKTKSMDKIEHDFSLGGSDDECEDEEYARGSEPSTPRAQTKLSNFMPTSRRLIQFANDVSKADKDSVVIYIDGAFDMFHPGHAKILKAAKELGDYLIVGVHDDDVVSKSRGRHYPIMSLHERSLSVLACRYVDEIIMGAPQQITSELLTTFNISIVAHGTVYESAAEDGQYALAIENGIFVEIESESDLSTREIVRRIVSNKDSFEAKFARKSKSEAEYYKQKTYVIEQ